MSKLQKMLTELNSTQFLNIDAEQLENHPDKEKNADNTENNNVNYDK